MNVENRLSSGSYVLLPTRKYPKVFLNRSSFGNAMKLYNPFSLKGKVLKAIATFFPWFNLMYVEGSDFSNFVDNLLGFNATLSLYLATDSKKLVYQICKEDSIYGVLKISTSSDFNELVDTEIGALKFLGKETDVSVPHLMLEGDFQGCRFFISEYIEGCIGHVSDEEAFAIAKQLALGISVPLIETAIYKSVSDVLSENDSARELLERLPKDSIVNIALVHGDFTPWNIINAKEFVLFDLERFDFAGLEQFDLITFFFQSGRFLYHLDGIELVDFVVDKIGKAFRFEVFVLFLFQYLILEEFSEDMILQKVAYLVNRYESVN